ncbi:hypothetical protein KQX54_017859 [Cotesia glomerata]|uniref:Uncharacterized protein n=1 Tax=Cotesia glomerata TaxID=32391 RepID=A0AAV7HKX8_COTGL|nr:hypothetical protein KQX54_017859 [Cotesia glomerata]
MGIDRLAVATVFKRHTPKAVYSCKRVAALKPQYVNIYKHSRDQNVTIYGGALISYVTLLHTIYCAVACKFIERLNKLLSFPLVSSQTVGAMHGIEDRMKDDTHQNFGAKGFTDHEICYYCGTQSSESGELYSSAVLVVGLKGSMRVEFLISLCRVLSLMGTFPLHGCVMAKNGSGTRA